MIDRFVGEYRFLSNFYKSKVKYRMIEYPTVEHAFQAAKTKNKRIALLMSEPSCPAIAKYKGRNLQLRDDWESIKDDVMRTLVWRKFQIPKLRIKLLETGNHKLVEGNTWNDTYWGVCRGHGKNMLGKILMETRDRIRNE